METYSLESLNKTFVEHAESAEKQREEMIIRWKNEYASDKVPEHLKDPFSLPTALLFMVQEIERLQEQVKSLEKAFTRVK